MSDSLPPENQPDLESRLRQEVESLVRTVEELTGLPSRWNGTVRVIEAQSMSFLDRRSFFAKKEWSCSFAVLDAIADREVRWASLLHEALHSISVGLTAQSYAQYAGWEEGVVEWLQRSYRPEVLRQLDINISASVFSEREENWDLENTITALKRLSAELPHVPEQEFFETLLKTPVAQRIAFVQSWGAREANSRAQFMRVFAETSSILRS